MTQDRVFDDPKHQAEYEGLVRDFVNIDRQKDSDFRRRVDIAKKELDKNTDPGHNSTNWFAIWLIALFFLGGLMGTTNKNKQ